MKNDPVQAALAQLDQADADLAKALASKWAVVAAKAARVAADRDRRELAPNIAKALTVLLRGPGSADKGCTAKTAMARALIRLDHDDAELFLKGMRHIQMEPSWGGSEDSAAEFRANCAMGFACASAANKLQELTAMVVDEKWPARSGALRAIAAVGGESAALLLRLKALMGDPEPEVISDCLAGLLAIEGADAVPFAVSMAVGNEAAILALGESRLPQAVDALKELFGRTVDAELRRAILLAFATARTESATSFLLEVIREGPQQTATAALRTLAIHRADGKIREAASQAVEQREDRHLDSVFFDEFQSGL